MPGGGDRVARWQRHGADWFLTGHLNRSEVFTRAVRCIAACVGPFVVSCVVFECKRWLLKNEARQKDKVHERGM